MKSVFVNIFGQLKIIGVSFAALTELNWPELKKNHSAK